MPVLCSRLGGLPLFDPAGTTPGGPLPGRGRRRSRPPGGVAARTGSRAAGGAAEPATGRLTVLRRLGSTAPEALAPAARQERDAGLADGGRAQPGRAGAGLRGPGPGPESAGLQPQLPLPGPGGLPPPGSGVLLRARSPGGAAPGAPGRASLPGGAWPFRERQVLRSSWPACCRRCGSGSRHWPSSRCVRVLRPRRSWTRRWPGCAHRKRESAIARPAGARAPRGPCGGSRPVRGAVHPLPG